MNIFLAALLCAFVGIYHIGAMTSNNAVADKLANVIANAIEKAQENKDEDKYMRDDVKSVNNNGAEKRESEEELVDLLRYTIDRLEAKEAEKDGTRRDNEDDKAQQNTKDEEEEEFMRNDYNIANNNDADVLDAEELEQHKRREPRRRWLRILIAIGRALLEEFAGK